MKTIAEQLNVKELPFTIKDSQGNEIYYEDSDGDWIKKEFDSKGNRIYYENSDGEIIDNRNIPEYTMEELIEKIGNFKLINKGNMKTIEVTTNQSKRYFTLRIKESGETVTKYRTIAYAKDEFEEMEMNTNQDWNDYLKTSQSYFKIG